MFRVIVAGGRNFLDYELLSNKLDYLLGNYRKEDIVIVCGMARGADTLGLQYANEHGIEVDYYPADWNKYGKAAGYIRNEQMAKNADALVAFWDGESKGTGSMIGLAKKHGLKIRIVSYRL